MKRFSAAIMAVFIGVGTLGCDKSPTPPSPPGPAPAVPDLKFTSAGVDTSLFVWTGGLLHVAYGFCYGYTASTAEIASMKFRRVEYSTFGPSGNVYFTTSDSHLIGNDVGIGRGGCFTTQFDPDLARPIATRYQLTFEYASQGVAETRTFTVSGDVTNKLPPQPFITKVTLTDDVGGGQRIIRQPRPITFTVTNIEGGTPPFLYQWKLNGFLLKDWSSDPTFTWEGLTLNGSPVVSGSYTMVVNVRRNTWSQTETGATSTFLLLF